MADAKLSELTEAASLSGDELVYVVDNPSTTPVDRKATVSTLLGTTHAHAASGVTNAPAGTIAATDVQAAINELDTEKLAKAGGTMSGELNMADQLLTRPLLKDYGEEAVANTQASGAVTLDLTTGNVRNVTLTGTVTFTFSNPTASGDACSFTLILRQDATGSRTVTWPASVDWAGGVAPTITTTASGVDVFTFLTVDGGTTWFGFTAGQAFA